MVFLLVAMGLAVSHCQSPTLSPQKECMERNRCSVIEGECFMKNLAVYSTVSQSATMGTEDGTILLGTCVGLGDTCKKNCMSSALF